jgi:hypothetical protein
VNNGLPAAGTSVRLSAGSELTLSVAGNGGVPGDAFAAVLNVVAVNPAAAGFLTVYPCLAEVPLVATVVYQAGEVAANTTIATLSGGGDVCVYTAAATDVVIDVTGWLGSGGRHRMSVVGPVRAMDSRFGLGGATRIRANSTVPLDVSSFVPAGTEAISLNVTSVSASAAGFVTLYPCGIKRPGTSSLNFGQGEVRPNNAIVGITNGQLCVYSSADTDVIIDITGAFGLTGQSYLPATPTRVLDTRNTPAGNKGERVSAYGVRLSELGDAEVAAASVTVTAVNHTAAGFVTTFGCSGARPATATLNPRPGAAAANGAIVPVPDGALSCLYTLSGGDLIVDLTGWWVN